MVVTLLKFSKAGHRQWQVPGENEDNMRKDLFSEKSDAFENPNKKNNTSRF